MRGLLMQAQAQCGLGPEMGSALQRGQQSTRCPKEGCDQRVGPGDAEAGTDHEGRRGPRRYYGRPSVVQLSNDSHKIDLSSYKRQTIAYMQLLHPNSFTLDINVDGVTLPIEISCDECSCTESVCICGAMPAPRIEQDMVKCLGPNLVAVQKKHGVVIDGLGNRNGERRLMAKWELGKKSGGKRPTRKQRVAEEAAGVGVAIWIHPHAVAEWAKLAGVDSGVD